MKKKKKDEEFLDEPEEVEDFDSEDVEDEDLEDELDDDVVEDVEEELPLDEEEEEEEEIAGEFEEPEEKQRDMLDIAADIPVQVVAVMGKKNITIKEMTSLKMGGVVELNRPANEVVDLVAGGKLIAKGELVEIEGKLGVRIVKMVK